MPSSLLGRAAAEHDVAGVDAGGDFAVAVQEDVVFAEGAFTQEADVPVAKEDVLPLAAVIDAVADIVATLGKWRGRIRYNGKGVGANVRL